MENQEVINTVVSPISDKVREKLLTVALEEGSTYWCLVDDYELPGISAPSFLWDFLREGGCVPILDVKTGEEVGELTYELMQRGESIMMEIFPYIFAEVLSGDISPRGADTWLQLAVLGEILYG